MVRWEAKAYGFAQRSEHVLLFSSDFVEIRHTPTGRLVQVISGQDIRLLSTGALENTPVLMARTGRKEDELGQSDELLELIQTSEISSPVSENGPPLLGRDSPSHRRLWDEWDM